MEKNFMQDILEKAKTNEAVKEVYKENTSTSKEKKQAGRKAYKKEEKAKPIAIYLPPATHEGLRAFEEQFQVKPKDAIKMALNMLLNDLKITENEESLSMKMIRQIIENGRN